MWSVCGGDGGGGGGGGEVGDGCPGQRSGGLWVGV